MSEQAKRPFPQAAHWRDGTPIQDGYGNAPDPRRLRAARGEGWAKQPTRDDLMLALAALVGAVDAVRWCYEFGQTPSPSMLKILYAEANRARSLYDPNRAAS